MTIIPSILISASMLCSGGSSQEIADKIKDLCSDVSIENVCDIKDILCDLEIGTNDKFFDECIKPVTTPAPTVVPEVTDKPVATPEATQAPEVTPEVTAQPTKSPVVTPESTKAPVATPTPESTSAPTDTEAYAYEVVELVNQERAKNGLSALTTDKTLMDAAQKRAVETNTSFSHTRPSGQNFSTVLSEFGISYRSAGENIAYGQKTPEDVVNAWMNSSGHRANILNSSYTTIGVGCYKSGNTYYWSQLFIN